MNASSSEQNPGQSLSAGLRFRQAVEQERPLQIVGAIHPLAALLAQQAGFRAIYLSGAGVANASHALPDLGITHLEDVVEDARRITSACQLPLLVDIDTGWGSEGNIARAIRELEQIGVAGVHMEDQVSAKRCGHRPGKELVDSAEMQARVRAAVAARRDSDFVIMARTDAVAVEGLESAIARANTYVTAGADMIFAEAITSAEDYRTFTQKVSVPVLANLTEFGKTPLLSLDLFHDCGIRMVLYPLTAFRAMNYAAQLAYETIRRDGNQAAIIDSLQTRDELYALLHYLDAEKKTLLGRSKP
ncbi:MAG: methylisocitrate lyase [Planctomycetes bacterium]|nr:methylisocitrate lyase [Planctomycetota bacterium]